MPSDDPTASRHGVNWSRNRDILFTIIGSAIVQLIERSKGNEAKAVGDFIGALKN